MSSTSYNKICPKCGAQMEVRQDVRTSSIPPMNIYDCPECGNVEYDAILYPCELGELVTQSKNEVDLCDKTDYRKKYEEALERARNLYPGVHSHNKAMLEQIFSELADSEDEDERIREAIINILELTHICTSNGIKRDEMIAYLKKQKTSEEAIRYVKENHSPDEVSDFQAAMNIAVAKAYDKGVQDTLEKQKDSIPYEKYVEDIAAINAEAKTKYHEGWNDGYEAKQKEQKPAEPSDEELVRHPPIAYTYPSDASRDEQLKRALIALLNSDLIKVAGNKFTKQDFIDWVEKQKPTENSDFKVRLADYMQKASQKDGRYVLSSESILKMAEEELLKRGVVQKPAEWSEDDEKCLQELMQHIEHCVAVYGASQPEWQQWLNLLNSIRPQPKQEWKPSEEQMNSLNYGIYVLEEEGYDASAREIKELYEQLKKLMEE